MWRVYRNPGIDERSRTDAAWVAECARIAKEARARMREAGAARLSTAARSNKSREKQFAPARGSASWWSEGWQRLMDIASREYDERALPYRDRCEHIYQRTMAAHERVWSEGVGGMTPNETEMR
jgi:hypothetical protein